MAYTQTQIDNLKRAYASGVLTVREGETSTTFRSLEEIKDAIREMEEEVSGTPRIRQILPKIRPGY